MVANGADALIGFLATAFLERGDEAVMGMPSFVSYVQDVLRAGGRPIEVPVRSDGALDLAAMAERVTDHTRLVFVCNPNNPTGGMLGRWELGKLLDALPTSVLVVLDEAYAEYVGAPDFPDGPALVASRPNVVVLRTFSKLFGLAGLRIGYLIGPPPVVTAIRRLRHWYDVTDAAHLAALACLDDPGEVARRAEATRVARDRLTTILAGHGLIALPSVASFVAVPVVDAAVASGLLARHGVLVRAVPAASGDLIRIGAGDDADLEALDAALAFACPTGGGSLGQA